MSTVGCQEAYFSGRRAYHNSGCWSEPPESFTSVETELWQEGFDDALNDELGLPMEDWEN